MLHKFDELYRFDGKQTCLGIKILLELSHYNSEFCDENILYCRELH